MKLQIFWKITILVCFKRLSNNQPLEITGIPIGDLETTDKGKAFSKHLIYPRSPLIDNIHQHKRVFCYGLSPFYWIKGFITLKEVTKFYISQGQGHERAYCNMISLLKPEENRPNYPKFQEFYTQQQGFYTAIGIVGLGMTATLYKWLSR